MKSRIVRLLRMQAIDFLDGAQQTLAQAGLPTSRRTIKSYVLVIAVVLASMVAWSVIR